VRLYFTAADIPLEVAKPVKLTEEPMVLALRRTPVMALMPTGQEVQLARW